MLICGTEFAGNFEVRGTHLISREEPAAQRDVGGEPAGPRELKLRRLPSRMEDARAFAFTNHPNG